MRKAKMFKADHMHRIPKGAVVEVGHKTGGYYTIWYKGRLGMVPLQCIDGPESSQQAIEGFDETHYVEKEKF